jgi:hypothetical protein
MNIYNKKSKVIENTDLYNKQTNYNIKKDNNIDFQDSYNCKNKGTIELNTELDPYNYAVNYFNRKDLKGQEYIYFPAYNQGAGKGFGNLNISNNIRNSESSRTSNENFKVYRESEITNRFNYIDDRFSQSASFQFNRLGDTTRLSTDIKYIDDVDYFKKPNIDTSNNDYYINRDITFTNTNENINEINYDEPKPNQEIINNIEKNNENQRLKQKQRLEKIQEINELIEKLKIKYKNNLTKEIILQELSKNKNPDNKNQTSNNINQTSNNINQKLDYKNYIDKSNLIKIKNPSTINDINAS